MLKGWHRVQQADAGRLQRPAGAVSPGWLLLPSSAMPSAAGSTAASRPGWRRSTRLYLRTLRNPKRTSWYGDLDPRSWHVAASLARSYRLGPSDLRRAATIVRTSRSSGHYLATLPRSGTNWLIAMLCSGLSIAEGNEGRFVLKPARTLAGDDGWVFDGPRHWWPGLPETLAAALVQDRGVEIGLPLFAVCHDPLEQGYVDHRRVRTVVTVREPLAASRSLAHMNDPDWILAEPRRLEAYFGRVPQFFQRWEERLVDPAVAERTLILTYEDLRRDPADALVRIADHWNLEVDPAVWHRAAETCSWEAMADLARDRPDTTRISVTRTGALPQVIEDHIEQICAGVGASFGYASPA